MEEKLSVVIITCNRKGEVIKAIESCITHTQRSFELVVVDNNSTDGTKDAIKNYCEERKIQLCYIYLNANMGVSFARNIGYQKATGDILFFIDDDAVVVSGTLSLDIVCDYMRTHSDVMACTGLSLDDRYGGKMNFVRSKKESALDYYQIRSYVGFNHFVRKGFTPYEYIYPNNLFYGSEELYVGLTILKYGGKIININEHIVQHNPSVNTRIDRKEGTRNGHINTFVIKKYFLTGIFRAISSIMFFFRILRFSKFHLEEIKKCLSLAKERYDPQYRNSMDFTTIVKSIRRFGIKTIL